MQVQLPLYTKECRLVDTTFFPYLLQTTRRQIVKFSKQVIDYIDELEEKDDK